MSDRETVAINFSWVSDRAQRFVEDDRITTHNDYRTASNASVLLSDFGLELLRALYAHWEIYLD